MTKIRLRFFVFWTLDHGSYRDHFQYPLSGSVDSSNGQSIQYFLLVELTANAYKMPGDSYKHVDLQKKKKNSSAEQTEKYMLCGKYFTVLVPSNRNNSENNNLLSASSNTYICYDINFKVHFNAVVVKLIDVCSTEVKRITLKDKT